MLRHELRIDRGRQPNSSRETTTASLSPPLASVKRMEPLSDIVESGEMLLSVRLRAQVKKLSEKNDHIYGRR